MYQTQKKTKQLTQRNEITEFNINSGESNEEMDSESGIGSGGSWVTFILEGFVLVWSCGVLCMIIAAFATRCCWAGQRNMTGYASRLSAIDWKKTVDSSTVSKVR